MKRNTGKSNAQTNQVRVIGGSWRGRKLPVANIPGLRPTGDRIRETLFNWLAPVIDGANCLDLFAGSGVLSIEALSRGAKHAMCLDKQAKVISTLKSIRQQLDAKGLDLAQQEAITWLESVKQDSLGSGLSINSFDIVFLDPPFDSELLQPSIDKLAECGCLKKRAWVYIERSRKARDIILPPAWTISREKQTGNICFSLIEVANTLG